MFNIFVIRSAYGWWEQFFMSSVADLRLWKGRALFSKVGGVVGKNYFLRSVRGSINSFFVRFCWEKSKNRKIFREGKGDRSQRPPLNPSLHVILNLI